MRKIISVDANYDYSISLHEYNINEPYKIIQLTINFTQKNGYWKHNKYNNYTSMSCVKNYDMFM